MKAQAQNKKREQASNKARPLEQIKVLHVTPDMDPEWKKRGLWELVMPQERTDG